ncbi:MAG: pyridoxamine 5'-phosphate oxidase family protein [Thermomicrobiales bacterium]
MARPHVAGVGAAWLDGDFYVTSNLNARKARNLAANPTCTIAVKLAGIDLTFFGTAAR